MLDDLKEILAELGEKEGITVSAIISRNGIPIAWHGLNDENKETFATLAATVLGATEVIYSGLGMSAPVSVRALADDGNLVILELNKKSLIAALGNRDIDELNEVLQGAVNRIREVFENER